MKIRHIINGILEKSKHVIGYRGTDGAKCHWIVVLMDHNVLITAYPVPHPKALKFMHRDHH